MTKIQAKEQQLDHIIGKTDILQQIPNKYLAKYLVAEILYGRGDLNGFSKPVECVRSNKEALMQALNDVDSSPMTSTNFYHKGEHHCLFTDKLNFRSTR
jgi:hypothetical protein